MNRYLAVAAVIAATASPASAQRVREPLTPENFRATAIVGDTFEMESSRNALQLSRDPRVRAFADQMIRDHGMTSQALMQGGGGVPGTATGALAGAVIGGVVGGPVGAVVGGVAGAATGAATSTPTYTAGPTLDARRADMLNRLVRRRGREFDRLYGQMQVSVHREAVGLYSAYAQVGTDPNLRAFAAQTLPHLQQHLAMAQRLAGAGGGSRRR
jgi:predicted outer membrane protein